MVGSGRRARAWWWRSALAALAGIATLECSSSDPPCQQAVLDRAWTLAAEQCELAYRESRHHDDGIALAKALSALGDDEAAVALATTLLATPARGTAHRVIATAARDDRNFLVAVAHGTAAAVIHIASDDDAELMRDAHFLSTVWWKEAWYDAALTTATLSRDIARRAGDRRFEGNAGLALADAYRMLGDARPARDALAAVEAVAETPCDHAWATLKRGLLDMDLGSPRLARVYFEKALTLGRRCAHDKVSPSAHANLAWLGRELGEPALTEAHLATIADDHFEVRVLRALLAADAGDLEGASAHLAATAALTAPETYWTWLVAQLEAELADTRGDPIAAEAAYQRAVAFASQMMRSTPINAPYVIALVRSSYEGLFALHARAGRWREALSVIAALDVDDVLRASAASGGLGAGGGRAAPGTAPGALSVLHPAIAPPVGIDQVVDAWRDRDLVVVLAGPRQLFGPDRGRTWRLRIVAGRVEGTDVGDAAASIEAARTLAADPFDRAAAGRLGALVIPPIEASTTPLDVILAGELGITPLAVLRHDDGLIIARRPLVRVLGIQPRPAPPARSGIVVLGDPREDLPAAADEAAWVARHFRTEARIHDDATVAQLATAAHADTLHVAGHVHRYVRDYALHLADRPIGPAEIIALNIGPRLVVLASCVSAVSGDEGGWTSLAAAFLRAGADHVVATQWSVRDKTTPAVVRGFYERGGAQQPAVALASVQVELADVGGGSSDWAAFTVLASPPTLTKPEARKPSMPPVTLTYAAVTTVEDANQYVGKTQNWVWVDINDGWVQAKAPIKSGVSEKVFAVVATYEKVPKAATILATENLREIKDPVSPPGLNAKAGTKAVGDSLKKITKKSDGHLEISPGPGKGKPS
jgi:tetratricopeptide (TPR) repeat protein